MTRERILRDPYGGLTVERYERDERGECGACGRAVVKVHGSRCTASRDGVRYSTDPHADAWGLVRCEGCHKPIADTWRPRADQGTRILAALLGFVLVVTLILAFAALGVGR